eukprot:COSAG02_NODE_15135_length_1200_cov_44.120862_1_plen_35_part_10
MTMYEYSNARTHVHTQHDLFVCVIVNENAYIDLRN